MAHGYWVFNAERADGFQAHERPPMQLIERQELAEAPAGDDH